MKSNTAFAALVLALAAAPIFAQDTGTTASPAAQQAPAAAATENQAAPATSEPDPGDEVICRRERSTGSLTRSTRTCMTRNEWNLSRQQARQSVDRYGQSGGTGQGCSNGGQGC